MRALFGVLLVALTLGCSAKGEVEVDSDGDTDAKPAAEDTTDQM